MLKRLIFWLFLLLFPIHSTAVNLEFATIQQLLEAIQNLTLELESVDNLGDKFYKLATDNQKYLAQFAGLPDQILGLNDNLNTAVPAVERSAYVLGACIVGAAVICIAPSVVKYLVRRHRKRNERLLEEVQVQ